MITLKNRPRAHYLGLHISVPQLERSNLGTPWVHMTPITQYSLLRPNIPTIWNKKKLLSIREDINDLSERYSAQFIAQYKNFSDTDAYSEINICSRIRVQGGVQGQNLDSFHLNICCRPMFPLSKMGSTTSQLPAVLFRRPQT